MSSSVTRLPRPGTARLCRPLYVFLASPAATHITGQIFQRCGRIYRKVRTPPSQASSHTATTQTPPPPWPNWPPSWKPAAPVNCGRRGGRPRSWAASTASRTGRGVPVEFGFGFWAGHQVTCSASGALCRCWGLRFAGDLGARCRRRQVHRRAGVAPGVGPLSAASAAVLMSSPRSRNRSEPMWRSPLRARSAANVIASAASSTATDSVAMPQVRNGNLPALGL